MSGSSNEAGSVGVVAAIPVAGLLILIAFVIGIAAATGGGGNCGTGTESVTGTLKGGVPKKFVPIYQAASTKYHLGPKGPAMLASIHFNETTFGTNTETSSAGAEGQMMFMPETWAAYGVDANGDGKKDPHDPEDAIFAAARYLRASGAPGNWHDAIFAYNHAEWYVERIEEDFQTFRGSGMEKVLGGEFGEACAPSFGGNAMLQRAERLFQPKAFKLLPERLMAGGRAPQAVDARIYANAVWLLENYDLRVTAAREGGHQTHGDGTALDIVPAPNRGWDGTVKRAAEDLGWRSSCASSGTAPVCPLAPAIQFIGYNGYDTFHGDPAHSTLPHLHLSWKSSSYGGCPGATCGPNEWVMAFPLA